MQEVALQVENPLGRGDLKGGQTPPLGKDQKEACYFSSANTPWALPVHESVLHLQTLEDQVPTPNLAHRLSWMHSLLKHKFECAGNSCAFFAQTTQSSFQEANSDGDPSMSPWSTPFSFDLIFLEDSP